MKALYIIIAIALLLALLLGSAAVQFTAVGVALGWVAYEDFKVKRYER